MRYFFAGYSFTENGRQKVSSITFEAPDMPNLISIGLIIEENFPSYKDVYVTSLSEWNKEDYFKLLKGQNEETDVNTMNDQEDLPESSFTIQKDTPESTFVTHLPEGLVDMPLNSVPFVAAFTYTGQPTIYVTLQNEEIDNNKVILVKYREEQEEAQHIDLEDADFLVYTDESDHWDWHNEALSLERMAIAAIRDHLLHKFDNGDSFND